MVVQHLLSLLSSVDDGKNGSCRKPKKTFTNLLRLEPQRHHVSLVAEGQRNFHIKKTMFRETPAKIVVFPQ